MPATTRWSRSHVLSRRLESLGREQLSEGRVVGIGAEGGQRPVVAGGEHPPAGPALGAVLAHQYAGTTPGGARKTRRTTDPRGRVAFGGDSRSTRPAWERWRATRSPPSKAKSTYLPRRPTALRARPTGRPGSGTAVLRPLTPSSSKRSRHRAGQARLRAARPGPASRGARAPSRPPVRPARKTEGRVADPGDDRARRPLERAGRLERARSGRAAPRAPPGPRAGPGRRPGRSGGRSRSSRGGWGPGRRRAGRPSGPKTASSRLAEA